MIYVAKVISFSNYCKSLGTAYTVPMGRVLAALDMRYMLRVRATKKPPHHQYCSAPTALLVLPRQNVKATSISPAMIRMIQFISALLFTIFLFKNFKMIFAPFQHRVYYGDKR